MIYKRGGKENPPEYGLSFALWVPDCTEFDDKILETVDFGKPSL